jgi:hypothetical protein
LNLYALYSYVHGRATVAVDSVGSGDALEKVTDKAIAQGHQYLEQQGTVPHEPTEAEVLMMNGLSYRIDTYGTSAGTPIVDPVLPVADQRQIRPDTPDTGPWATNLTIVGAGATNAGAAGYLLASMAAEEGLASLGSNYQLDPNLTQLGMAIAGGSYQAAQAVGLGYLGRASVPRSSDYEDVQG